MDSSTDKTMQIFIDSIGDFSGSWLESGDPSNLYLKFSKILSLMQVVPEDLPLFDLFKLGDFLDLREEFKRISCCRGCLLPLQEILFSESVIEFKKKYATGYFVVAKKIQNLNFSYGTLQELADIHKSSRLIVEGFIVEPSQQLIKDFSADDIYLIEQILSLESLSEIKNSFTECTLWYFATRHQEGEILLQSCSSPCCPKCLSIETEDAYYIGEQYYTRNILKGYSVSQFKDFFSSQPIVNSQDDSFLIKGLNYLINLGFSELSLSSRYAELDFVDRFLLLCLDLKIKEPLDFKVYTLNLLSSVDQITKNKLIKKLPATSLNFMLYESSSCLEKYLSENNLSYLKSDLSFQVAKQYFKSCKVQSREVVSQEKVIEFSIEDLYFSKEDLTLFNFLKLDKILPEFLLPAGLASDASLQISDFTFLKNKQLASLNQIIIPAKLSGLLFRGLSIKEILEGNLGGLIEAFADIFGEFTDLAKVLKLQDCNLLSSVLKNDYQTKQRIFLFNSTILKLKRSKVPVLFNNYFVDWSDFNLNIAEYYFDYLIKKGYIFNFVDSTSRLTGATSG